MGTMGFIGSGYIFFMRPRDDLRVNKSVIFGQLGVI